MLHLMSDACQSKALNAAPHQDFLNTLEFPIELNINSSSMDSARTRRSASECNKTHTHTLVGQWNIINCNSRSVCWGGNVVMMQLEMFSNVSRRINYEQLICA